MAHEFSYTNTSRIALVVPHDEAVALVDWLPIRRFPETVRQLAEAIVAGEIRLPPPAES